MRSTRLGVRDEDQPVGVDVDALLPAARADGGLDEGAEVDTPGLTGCVPASSREISIVLDEVAEPLHVLDEELGRPAGLGGHLLDVICEERGFVHDRGQRRAQLVRDVRGKPPLARLRLREGGDLGFERVGHLVERRCPEPELVRASTGRRVSRRPSARKWPPCSRARHRGERPPGDQRPCEAGEDDDDPEPARRMFRS